VGLNTAHTQGCVLQLHEKKRKAYKVAQQCIDAGVGQAPVVNEEMKISVVNENKFLLTKAKTTLAFHYCSPSL